MLLLLLLETVGGAYLAAAMMLGEDGGDAASAINWKVIIIQHVAPWETLFYAACLSFCLVWVIWVVTRREAVRHIDYSARCNGVGWDGLITCT